MDCSFRKNIHNFVFLGVFGPPLGMRYVLFIDDVNASTSNKYDVYSSIELLRHYIEYEQWYNTENATPVQLVDLQVNKAPMNADNPYE